MATSRHSIFIKKIAFKGFKSIYDLDVEVSPGFNIIIGKNGAGKSNFLEMMNLSLINFRFNTSSIPFRYCSINLEAEDGRRFVIEQERVTTKSNVLFEDIDDRKSFTWNFYIDGELTFSNRELSDANQTKSNKQKVRFQNPVLQLRRMGYKTIYPLYIKYGIPKEIAFISVPSTIRIPIDNDAEWDFPMESMSFIDNALWELESSYLEFEKITSLSKLIIKKNLKIEKHIIQNLRAFSPIADVRFNDNINIYSTDKEHIIENVRIDFKINGNWLPWSQLSDGTRRLFYIISSVSSDANGPVLIEEPELGIHPHQFSQVMDFLKQEARSKQIFISTHSPEALNHLAVEELDRLLVASFDKRKGTQLKHLTNAQKRKAKIYMKDVGFLSDYWALSDLEK